MQLPLQIASRDVELSPAERELIRAEAAKIESFWDRIVSCRVLVEVPHRRGHSGRSYRVRIEVNLPGGELVVTRQPQAQLLDAVQAAFKAAARRVQDRVRKVRGDVKLDRGAPRGTVIRLFPWEGYGFLVAEDGREIYFDRNSVAGGRFDRLEEGMDVRFAEVLGEKGPQASTVAIGRSRRVAARQAKP